MGVWLMRIAVIDRARGFAVALMVLDHVLVFLAPSHPLRLTVTRAAMPLFFVISGALCRRLTRRTLAVGLLGVFLPAVAPWAGRPSVLLVYALGAVLVVYARPRGALPWVAVVALAVAANHGVPPTGTGFWSLGLIGLMAIGAAVDVERALAWARRLPAWLGQVGRYPLSVYVGHVLVFSAMAGASR